MGKVSGCNEQNLRVQCSGRVLHFLWCDKACEACPGDGEQVQLIAYCLIQQWPGGLEWMDMSCAARSSLSRKPKDLFLSEFLPSGHGADCCIFA